MMKPRLKQVNEGYRKLIEKIQESKLLSKVVKKFKKITKENRRGVK